MPSVQELNQNLEKVNQLLLRINKLYDFPYNRLLEGDQWDDFLTWYEECFEFLIGQKEKLSNILNNLNRELFTDDFYFIFFLEKMEAISQITHKNELYELYLEGEKIHEVIDHYNQNCACLNIFQI